MDCEYVAILDIHSNLHYTVTHRIHRLRHLSYQVLLSSHWRVVEHYIEGDFRGWKCK